VKCIDDLGCRWMSKQDDVHSPRQLQLRDGGHHNKPMILKAPNNEQLGTFNNLMIHYLQHVSSLDQLNHRYAHMYVNHLISLLINNDV
jgi:hypothetical protein